MEKCKIKDCEGGAYCRGWCKKHYTRWERYGDPNIVHERHRFTKADITKAVDANKTYRTEDDSLYFIWDGMKARCERRTHKDYLRYGGKGVRVCSRWLGKDGYKHFCEDMGERPSQHHSIDRIDSTKGYSPENCRWATPREQILNRSSTIWVEYDGKRMCLFDFAKQVGVSNSTLWWRYKNNKEVFPGAVVTSGSF